VTSGSTDVVEMRVRVPPAEIAYVKFIFESYEGIAVVRTLDPTVGDIVLLVAPDFAADARQILASLGLASPSLGVDCLIGDERSAMEHVRDADAEDVEEE
jgi:hypothetical protein